VTITTLNGEETYEILNIIEFTNSRKRMSVIVRAPDGQIKLFCKVVLMTINIMFIILNNFLNPLPMVLGRRYRYY